MPVPYRRAALYAIPSSSRAAVFRRTAACTAALLLLFVFLCFAPESASLAKSALFLAAHSILPALFPAMTAARLLVSRLPPGGSLYAAFLCGMVCGFPVGASVLSDAVKQGFLSRRDASNALSPVSCTSPAFCSAALGAGMLGSARVGWFFWIVCCVLSVLLWALFYRVLSAPKKNQVSDRSATLRTAPTLSFGAALADAISRSATASLGICGCVVFFSVVGGLLTSRLATLNVPDRICSFVFSLLEVGSGSARCATLSGLSRLPLCAFSVGFGGASVYMQTLLCADNLDLSHYLPFRLAVGAAAAILTALFLPFLHFIS